LIVKIENPTKVCSGLDNACNIITGSIVLYLTFINEINNIKETFCFKPRILISSPIDIIIGRETIKTENLALKIPSTFFNDNFIDQNKNFFLINQDALVENTNINSA